MWQDVPLISPFMVECKERQEAGLTASTGIKNMFSLALEQAQDFVTDRGKQDVNFQTLKGSHFHWEDSLRETSGSAQDGVDIDSPVAQTTKTKSTFYSPKTTTTTPTIIDVSESVTTSTSTSTSSSSSSTSTSSQTSHGQSNPHEESPGSCQGLSLNLMQLAVGDVVSVASRTWPGRSIIRLVNCLLYCFNTERYVQGSTNQEELGMSEKSLPSHPRQILTHRLSCSVWPMCLVERKTTFLWSMSHPTNCIIPNRNDRPSESRDCRAVPLHNPMTRRALHTPPL